MDKFLNDIECIKRLCAEYEKHGSVIIALDFDNTIFDYYGDGSRFDQVIDIVREAKEIGCVIILFTSCNEDRFDEIKEYMETNKIPYDLLNETPEYIPFKGRKVYYNLLLDDRAGLSSAYNQLRALIAHVRSIKSMKNIELV